MRKSRKTSAYLSVLVILVLSFLALPFLGGGAAVADNTDWTETSVSGISILDIEALDASTAWAVGYGLTGGSILKTTDGGANWAKQKTITALWPAQAFSSISVVDANIAWASGDRKILRTTDGGATWDTVLSSSALIEWVPDVSAVDANNAWAITVDILLNSHILGTADGGATWVNLYTRSYSEGLLSRISALDCWNAWAAGGALTNGTSSSAGSIVKTNNMGITWEEMTPADAPVFLSVLARDNNDVWVTGKGTIMHTTDAGATWTTCYTTTGTELWGLSVTDDSTIWAAGKAASSSSGARILKTVNGGSSWQTLYSSSSRHLYCIASADAVNVWAGGGNSTSTSATILRTAKGGDALPDIKAVTPASGSAGDTVTISGSDFGATRGTSKVFFNGVEAASYTSWSSGAIAVKVPAGVGGYVKVTVATAAGTSNPMQFLVAIPINVDSIDPASGMQFTFSMDVKLKGSGFLQGTTVRFVNGDLAMDGFNVNVVSETELTCTVGLFGAEVGVYDVVVTSPAGNTDTLAGGFAVTSACGAGAGTAALAFGGMLGLLSVGRGLKRRRRR